MRALCRAGRVLSGALLGAACTVAPPDPLPAAQRALDAGDLLRAVAHLDQVAPAHPLYPKARELSDLLQARIAESQRNVAEGLHRQAVGDAAGAEQAFASARAAWPRVILADDIARPRVPVALIADQQSAAPTPTPDPGSDESADQLAAAPNAAATAPDLAVAPHAAPQQETALQLRSPPPLAQQHDENVPTWTLPAPPGFLAHAASANASLPTAAADDNATAVVPLAVTSAAHRADDIAGEPVTDLVTLRALAQGRDQRRAVAQLMRAHGLAPQNQDIRELLAAILRKRALVAYGRGWLDAAVDDWQQVVHLAPDDRTSRAHLATARAELERRATRDEKKKNAGG
jgi:hypothetical protein